MFFYLYFFPKIVFFFLYNKTYNTKGIQLLARLRLSLTHVRLFKFKNNFKDCLNPFGNCGQNIETLSRHVNVKN